MREQLNHNDQKLERWYDVAQVGQVEAVMFTDDGTGIVEVALCSTDTAPLLNCENTCTIFTPQRSCWEIHRRRCKV